MFGAAFDSSVLAPFFLGTVAGGVASGRVPLGNAADDLAGSWVNRTSLLGGTLAVAVCAYPAAVFLTVDATRDGSRRLADAFRRRGLGAGFVAGAIALGGIVVLRADAPLLYAGSPAAPSRMVISAAGGLVALVLVRQRRYQAARVVSVVSAVAVVWGWAAPGSTRHGPAGALAGLALRPVPAPPGHPEDDDLTPIPGEQSRT